MTARRERGSALILMPAVVLVLLVLGVIALDSAVEYLGHRQLADFTSEAADDAAAQALDQPSFYAGGRLKIDANEAQGIVDQLRRTASTGGVQITSALATVSPGGNEVTVRATGTVHDVFGPAISGHRTISITATSSATAHEVQTNP